MQVDYKTFYYSPDDDDAPLERAKTAEEASSHRKSTELHSFPDTETGGNPRMWEFNYREAAIFIEEGLSNDKLTAHPRCRKALDRYLLVHNKWFHAIDFVASMLLILLPFTEKPANPILRVIQVTSAL